MQTLRGYTPGPLIIHSARGIFDIASSLITFVFPSLLPRFPATWGAVINLLNVEYRRLSTISYIRLLIARGVGENCWGIFLMGPRLELEERNYSPGSFTCPTLPCEPSGSAETLFRQMFRSPFSLCKSGVGRPADVPLQLLSLVACYAKTMALRF